MGMDFRGLVWKRVWKITFFGLKLGSGFGEPGGTPLPRIPRSIPSGGADRFVSGSIGNFPWVQYSTRKHLPFYGKAWEAFPSGKWTKKENGQFRWHEVKIFTIRQTTRSMTYLYIASACFIQRVRYHRGICQTFTVKVLRYARKSPTERERLLPSIYSAGPFKRVWAVCTETINFLHRWDFFIGTKYTWFLQGPFYSNCAARYSRWSPTSYEEGCLRADVSYFLCCTRATKEIGDVCTQAMKRDEVRLMVFTDYLKAFNTVLRQY